MKLLTGSKDCWNQTRDEYPMLIISEIIDAKRRHYLNV